MKFSNTIKTVLKIDQKYVKNSVWFSTGTESHTHSRFSTSFRLVVVIDRAYVRVYRLYGWGRVDYQKEGRSVSGVSLQIHTFILDIYNIVN